MPENNLRTWLTPLGSRAARVISCILAIQIVLFYSVSTAEFIPHPPPLETLQTSAGPWQMTRQTPTEPEIQAFLKADDSVNREYSGPQGEVDLFVAFYKSQRAGVATHSPKVCLPGNGWTPESSRVASVNVPGEAKAIPVNLYVVRHGEQRDLVMYWYQGAHRVVASEYLAKLYLMLDSLRYHRSDEAMVRVIAPVAHDDEAQAERTATEFTQAIYNPLKNQLWH